MRRLALLLLLAPPLLAPVRYQSGEDTIMLNPAQGPSKNAVELPAAGPLSSPTVISVSPNVLSPTVVTPITITPTVVVIPRPADNLMPETSALICISAMKAVSDIALLSYQQQRQPAVVKLTITANMAASIASNRQYPYLSDFTQSYQQLRYNTPQKAQLTTAVGTAQTACANPRPGKLTPGSRVPIERPN